MKLIVNRPPLSEPDDRSAAEAHPLRILLADDDADTREYVKRLLGACYDVTAVGDGFAALELARQHVPDLVLADITTPGLNGFALLRELRAEKRTRRVPVILLSARADQETRIEGLEAGADDYLTKPFSGKEVLARVEATLKLQRALHKVQAEAQRQRRLYEAILTNTPDLAYVFDLNHRFIYANEGLLKMWGRTLDDALGKNCLELGYEPWHAAAHDREIERVITTRQPIRGVVPFTGTFGRRLYDYIFVPVIGADGQVEAVAGTSRDVTDLTGVQEELRQSEERFRAIVEQSTAGISQIDLEGRFLLVNDRYCEITGYSREELLGKRRHDIIHRQDLSRQLESFQRLVNEGISYSIEKRYIRKDGSTVWVSNSVSAILDAAGRPQYAVAVTIDISDRKSREEELKTANADLEQFAYSASHDLQEPLRGMSIYSELLAKRFGEKLDADALDFLNYLRTNAIRMEALVGDLLAYTQAMRIEPTAQICDSNDALGTALTSLKEAVRESKAVITFDRLPSVSIRCTHLQQVFQNLIGNAIKYRTPGQAPVVHIGAERQDEIWIFSVKDNGIGIAPQYKEQVFGVFKRLHTSQEYAGTGIGLAICQRIVERYHGRIWVESEPGKGSTFRFTLPV